MNHSFSATLFEEMPVVGIMRGIPPVAMHKIADLYLESGLTTLEITMNSAGALPTLKALSRKYGTELNIGAGTVLNLEELENALSFGAQFIVTPVLNKTVIDRCVEKGIPVFPGAYTPTEIYQAWEMGADMVKVFPASGLGADYIKNVKAPMNFLKLLPTGGIDLENCLDFFQAGASGIALGSSLFPRTFIEHENWTALSALFEQFRNRIREFRRG
jgi:2-dehydro-3-deoxyphosphogluconate aldolase/(4S)-4-hydroxy-2-oxoglutarate aldolase